jgi:hypothetical protein
MLLNTVPYLIHTVISTDRKIMKSHRREVIWIAIILILFSLPAWSQFEGTVISTTTGTRGPNSPFTITQEISIKGKKVRSNMSSPGEPRGAVSIIYRGDRGRIITILEQEKMYMEYSLKTIHQMMKNIPHDTNRAVVTRTGKTQKILGYNCEQVLIHQGEVDIEIWGTTELSSLRESIQALNEMQKQNVPRWSRELDKMKLFPMKTTISAQGTNAETDVTSIQKKSLPEAFFNVPAGYTKQELPTGQPPGGQKKR